MRRVQERIAGERAVEPRLPRCLQPLSRRPANSWRDSLSRPRIALANSVCSARLLARSLIAALTLHARSLSTRSLALYTIALHARSLALHTRSIILLTDFIKTFNSTSQEDLSLSVSLSFSPPTRSFSPVLASLSLSFALAFAHAFAHAFALAFALIYYVAFLFTTLYSSASSYLTPVLLPSRSVTSTFFK